MSLSSRWQSCWWVLVCGIAGMFLIFCQAHRLERIKRVTAFAQDDVHISAKSVTGYAGGLRWLIVPEHSTGAYQAIAETQQMLGSGTWRVRRVTTENAPEGRQVLTPSPLRWWLALLARIDQAINNTPTGIAVERAALLSGPLLQFIVLLGVIVFAARAISGGFAAMIAAGSVVVFPLGGAYLPGLADNFGLWLACVWGSALPLVAHFAASGNVDESRAIPPRGRGVKRFFAAGAAAGMALWIDASATVPLVLALAGGALVAAIVDRPSVAKSSKTSADPDAALWRWWAFGGAIIALFGYLLEFAPDRLDWRLEVNHPLYGLAWLGLGEALVWAIASVRSRQVRFSIRTGIVLALSGAAVVAPLIVGVRLGTSLAHDPLALRLTHLPGGAMSASTSAWIAHDGINSAVVATLIPGLSLLQVAWKFFANRGSSRQRAALALLTVPAVVALGLAFGRLRWWNVFDILLLLLAATAFAPMKREGEKSSALVGRYGLGIAAAASLAGLWALVPSVVGRTSQEFSKLEVESLIERNLAHWLAFHSSSFPVTVLAPPDRTVTLDYFGSLQGLGTPNWDNRDGVAATTKILTATTADEAFALLGARGISHIVLPSWDSDLDDFVRWEMPHPENSFLAAINRWALPPQLRPLPYPMPNITGYENYSVLVLAVTEETDRAASVSRIVEYFLETNQRDRAFDAEQALQPYPANLGALVARAQTAKARDDEANFEKLLGVIVAGVNNGLDRSMAWDRRVSLAVTLAQGHRNDLAEAQLKKCLKTVNENRIRSLTSASLYRFQLLAKAFNLAIDDPQLSQLARELTPPELRDRI